MGFCGLNYRLSFALFEEDNRIFSSAFLLWFSAFFFLEGNSLLSPGVFGMLFGPPGRKIRPLTPLAFFAISCLLTLLPLSRRVFAPYAPFICQVFFSSYF